MSCNQSTEASVDTSLLFVDEYLSSEANSSTAGYLNESLLYLTESEDMGHSYEAENSNNSSFLINSQHCNEDEGFGNKQPYILPSRTDSQRGSLTPLNCSSNFSVQSSPSSCNSPSTEHYLVIDSPCS